MKKNFISVLLPIYNAEAFLAETLDSLLRQSNKNFEVIAINDGSTDGSLDILRNYAHFDSRIIIVDQKNMGLVKSLNRAAEMASGEFLARLDADDIALVKRFELQLAAINDDPKRVLVAGSFDVMDEDGDILYHDSVPTNYKDIFNAMYVRNPLAHSSVLIRKSAFDQCGGYSETCGPTEDYDLWTRLADVGEIIAVRNTLFRWRINPNGITTTKAKIMESYMKKNINNFWDNHPYRLVSRAALLKRVRGYLNNDPRHGIATKHTVLRDLADISVMLIKRKRILDGVIQLFVIASTGRTGIRIVHHRLLAPIKYYSRLSLGKHE